MKPHEFWNCTYKEASEYVKANSLQREKDLKQEIVLFDALGEKIINAIARKKPKNISLVHDTFKELFKKELEKDGPQSIEEQIRNLRSRE